MYSETRHTFTCKIARNTKLIRCLTVCIPENFSKSIGKRPKFKRMQSLEHGFKHGDMMIGFHVSKLFNEFNAYKIKYMYKRLIILYTHIIYAHSNSNVKNRKKTQPYKHSFIEIYVYWFSRRNRFPSPRVRFMPGPHENHKTETQNQNIFKTTVFSPPPPTNWVFKSEI